MAIDGSMYATFPHWEFVGSLEVCGKVSISDSSYFFDSAVIVDVEAGNYLVELLFSAPGAAQEAVRVRPASPEITLRANGYLGEVLVDFGQIGICDREHAVKAFEQLGDDGMSRYYDQLSTDELVREIKICGEAKMLLIRPPSGDGSYPVYRLISQDGRRAGFEVHFVARALSSRTE
jgi:hypothetical protein